MTIDLLMKLVLQVLAVGVALLISRLDYWDNNKRTRRFKRRRVWLLCLTLLFLVASVVVTVLDDNARRLDLQRNLQRIEDVGIEFRALLPMDIPALARYSERVSSIIHSMRSSLPSQESTIWGSMTVSFISKTRLFPDLETERTAYTFLSHVCIELAIFVDEAKAETFIPEAGHSQVGGDLAFSLSRSAHQTERNDVFLGIDVSRRTFSLSGHNAKTGPSEKNTGKIVSVLDLAGATAVMYFCPKGGQDEAERREFLSVASALQMVVFGLNFSGGQKIGLRPEGRMNKYGEQVYILKFPKTVRGVEALIQK
jgi:hypothetical protein